MTSSEQAAAQAAAVGPGIFELGGRTFVLSPMRGPDWMAVRAELRRQCIQGAENPLIAVNADIAEAEKAGRPFSPTTIKAMVAEAMAARTSKDKKTEPTDAEISARAETLEASRWIVWYRLRKVDPTVTLEWVAEHIPDAEARHEVLHRLAELEGLVALDPKKA